MPAQFLNEGAIDLVKKSVIKLIVLNKLEEALGVLEGHFSNISFLVTNSIILNQAQLNQLRTNIASGLVSDGNAQVAFAKIQHNLLYLVDSVIPDEMEVQGILRKLNSSLYETTNATSLEAILGPDNNMVKINWLQKGISASKSVCQVVRGDGARGTGFLINNGFLMTNCHVLPDKDAVASANIIFDYEEDLYGNMRKTSQFLLEPDIAKFSPIEEYDYAYVKVRENPANPVSQWGNLDLDTTGDPKINNAVTIIQHPLGETKKIALTANKIIGINGYRLLYQTDTQRGSSGSPVFNQDWKVIALHHAGKSEEDGGLVIDPVTGFRSGANEGILIKNIAHHIGLL